MVVLDAAALLAYLLQEPGAAVVDGLLSDAPITRVNGAEVVQKSPTAGVQVRGMRVSCGPSRVSRVCLSGTAPASA